MVVVVTSSSYEGLCTGPVSGVFPLVWCVELFSFWLLQGRPSPRGGMVPCGRLGWTEGKDEDECCDQVRAPRQ